MTRDDIRKLIGGYASGTLTDAEQKILFDAALDDQELFDELAREQALKDLLDEPGAKQRLIAALKPREPSLAWWRRPFVWSTALIAAAAIIATAWLATRPEQRTQVAEVAPAPAPPPAVAFQEPGKPSGTPPGNRPAPRGSLVRPESKPRKADNPERTPEPQADLAAPAGPPPPAPAQITPIQPAQAQFVPAQPVPGQPPSPQPSSPQPPPTQAAPAAPRAKQAESSGGGGARAQRVENAKAAGLMAPATAAARRRFGFDYRLEPDGHLEVKTAVDGYLSVADVFPETFVAKDSTTRIDVPAGGNSGSLTVHFSAQPRAGSTPVTIERDTAAGAVDDPNPSPDSNLVLRLILK